MGLRTVNARVGSSATCAFEHVLEAGLEVVEKNRASASIELLELRHHLAAEVAGDLRQLVHVVGEVTRR